MRIPDIEMRPGEIWKLRFRVRHIIPGREVDERTLRQVIERRIKRIKKLELLCVSPVIEGYFSVTVKVLENPIKVITVVAIILAAGLATGFLIITFVGAEKIVAEVTPAVARGTEIGIIIIAAAIAIMILSAKKIKK